MGEFAIKDNDVHQDREHECHRGQWHRWHRTVDIDIALRYREVGARSVGKGLFVKPDFDGAESTW
jgi:hypothetical protein